jgi:hypothetical protein
MAFLLSDRWHPAGCLCLFFLLHASSLRSPNARNKFAFALGERKLPAGSLCLFFLLHASRCHQGWWRSMAFLLSDRWHPAGCLCLFFLLHASSLRSPNARNKFAFALGERKLPAGSLCLFFLPHVSRCHQSRRSRPRSASGMVAFHGVPSYRTAGILPALLLMERWSPDRQSLSFLPAARQ